MMSDIHDVANHVRDAMNELHRAAETNRGADA